MVCPLAGTSFGYVSSFAVRRLNGSRLTKRYGLREFDRFFDCYSLAPLLISVQEISGSRAHLTSVTLRFPKDATDEPVVVRDSGMQTLEAQDQTSPITRAVGNAGTKIAFRDLKWNHREGHAEPFCCIGGANCFIRGARYFLHISLEPT